MAGSEQLSDNNPTRIPRLQDQNWIANKYLIQNGEGALSWIVTRYKFIYVLLKKLFGNTLCFDGVFPFITQGKMFMQKYLEKLRNYKTRKANLMFLKTIQ